MKKTLSFILALVMLCSTFAGLQVTSYALSSSGSCGENATYTFSESTGELVISGSGAINKSAFYEEKYIKSVTINYGITKIGESAFAACKKLTTVTFPNTLTDIDSYAFSGCERLASVDIPDNVSNIGSSAFSSCSDLKTAHLPSCLTIINNGIFYDCYSLKNIVIPDSVTQIGEYAFYHCGSLAKITFGSSLQFIGQSAFEEVSSDLQDIQLPEGLREIGDRAFYFFSGFSRCQSIHIPTTVKEIGEEAFYGRIWSDVYIPASVMYIGNRAFDYDFAYRMNCSELPVEPYKIFGEAGSEAEYYAKEEGIKFIADLNHKHNYNITYFEHNMNGPYVAKTCSCGKIGDWDLLAEPYGPVLAKPKAKYYYTGSEVKPEIIMEGMDDEKIDKKYYTIKYSNNVNVGTAKAKIVFNGYYDGYNYLDYSLTFKILPKKISSCNIDNYTYTGKAIVPVPYYYKTVTKTDSNGKKYTQKVKTKLKKGKDYTISVSGNHKSIGKYTVTLKGKGNFTGTVKKTFQILPKPVTKSSTAPYSTSAIKVSWGKVSGISGYAIYRYNNQKKKWVKYKNTTSTSMVVPRVNAKDTDVHVRIWTYKKVGGKVYYNLGSKVRADWNYTKPGKATVKLANTDFGKFKASFNRYAGHQIQISDNKSFSNKGGNTCYTLNKTCSSISYSGNSMSKYYVRAREYYYGRNGKLVVGSWSDVKTIMTY